MKGTADAHVHFYSPAMGEYSWPRRGSPWYRPFTPELLREDAGDLLGSCVAVGCADEPELNRRLLALAEDEPLIGAYIAQIDPEDPDCAEYAAEYARSPKYRGFRVYAVETPGFRDRLSALIGMGPSVVELVGAPEAVAELAGIAWDFPGIRFVYEHFAGVSPDAGTKEEDLLSFYEKLAAPPNTVMKLSGLFSLCPPGTDPAGDASCRSLFRAAYAAFGPERCAFGSDWPICGVPYATVVRTFRALAGEGADAVMGETARRVYGITEE